jgi:NADH-quinone oxidoreductase subunit M
VLVVTALSSIGLPGLNGFPGEFLVLMGAFEARRWTAAAAGLGMILGAVYTLWMVRRVLFGPRTNARLAELEDLRPLERAALAPLVALYFILGLFPGGFVRGVEPAAAALAGDVRAAREARQAADGFRHEDAKAPRRTKTGEKVDVPMWGAKGR